MSGEPTLHKGVSDQHVVQLQEMLRDRGFWHGATDGTFDDELEQAVQLFQDSTGLMQTGVVDADTWLALEQHAPAMAHAGAHSGHGEHAAAHHEEAQTSHYQTLHKGVSGDWVVYLQQQMQDRGYWHGAVDGAFDDELENAVGVLQEHCGLPRTGVVDLETWHTIEQLPHYQPEQHAEHDTDQHAETATGGSHPTLRKGVSSEWVVYLQQVMQHVGQWSGEANGTFDDALETAVMRMQDAHGLMQTGVVDADTWALLDRLQHQPAAPESVVSAHRSVAEMSASEKLIEAFNRAQINAAVRERILASVTPEALAAAAVSFGVVFVASQFTPVGWAADIAIGLTAVFLGTALFRAANHLIHFAAATDATTDAQLDAAGQAFANAVAEIEIDALLFLLTRAVSGPGGGTPAGPSTGGGVVLATNGGGQLVIVAAETIPAAVATELGIAGAANAMAMAGDPRDLEYWEDRYGDLDDDRPRRQRISDGNKMELENSAWLRRRLPDDERRRQFMEWLEHRHDNRDGPHVHERVGT